jgi:predicted CopG family antitoxin
MSKRINVGLRQDVYSKLKDKGRFGETFSDLISRIVDELEGNSPQWHNSDSVRSQT